VRSRGRSQEAAAHLPGGRLVDHFDLLPLLVAPLHQDRDDHVLVHVCEGPVVLELTSFKKTPTFKATRTSAVNGAL